MTLRELNVRCGAVEEKYKPPQDTLIQQALETILWCCETALAPPSKRDAKPPIDCIAVHNKRSTVSLLSPAYLATAPPTCADRQSKSLVKSRDIAHMSIFFACACSVRKAILATRSSRTTHCCILIPMDNGLCPWINQPAHCR